MANNMNLSQPQIPMFKGENFGFWRIKMKTLLLLQNLWDFVENGYTEPNARTLACWTQDQRNQKENSKKDSKSLFLIQQTVHDSIFPRLVGVTKSKEA